MKILSHRGDWKNETEKNSLDALQSSFENNFGFETDIREYCGDLVISHDIANSSSFKFDELLKSLSVIGNSNQLTMALNIKSDGLIDALLSSLSLTPSIDYFVFDMSIPEMRRYLNSGLKVFTRMSEVEISPIWLNDCSGVWLDSFNEEWFTVGVIEDLLARNKEVCIVSPELHQREFRDVWQRLKVFKNNSKVSICTDYPQDAKFFFSE